MSKKMLVIPGPFVPYNDSISLLTYKRLAYLDLEIDVLTIGGKIDLSLLEDLKRDTNYNKFRIETFNDYKKMDIVRNPLCIFYFIYTYFVYKRKALKKVKENNYDFLFTSSLPGMTHLIGKNIKKRYNIKWFASFSDPIKNSPYKNNPDIRKKSYLYRLAYKIGTFFYMGDFYESSATKNADKLIFICEEQRDYTCSQYHNKSALMNKSLIMPLTIEEKWDIYKGLFEDVKITNKPLVASHLGRVYGLRKIDNFLLALKELKDEKKISKEIILFNQYDEIEDCYKRAILELGLEDIFVINEKVNYRKAVDIMQKSDILLLFDTLMPNEKIQPYLPSKIAEYLVLRKPILAIADPNSPSYRILKEYGYCNISSGINDIKVAILDLIQNHSKMEYNIENLYAENNKNILEKEIMN